MEAIRVKRFLAGAMTFGMLVGSVLGNSLSLHAASPKDLVPVSVQDMTGQSGFIADTMITYEADKAMFDAFLNDVLGVTQAKIAGKSLGDWNAQNLSDYIRAKVPGLTEDGQYCLAPDGRWGAQVISSDGYWSILLDGTRSDRLTDENIDYYAKASGGGNTGQSSIGFKSTTALTLGNASNLSTFSAIGGTSVTDLFVDRTDVSYHFSDGSSLELYPDKDDSTKKSISYRIENVGSLMLIYEDGQLESIYMTTFDGKNIPAGVNTEETPGAMYRMYNPNSGEHFYTASNVERSLLLWTGWAYEGIAWIAPTSSNTPVYRLYNPNSGEHHYTSSIGERDALLSMGWNDEGIGWYSNDSKATPMYRLYNPNATGDKEAGAHHYTNNSTEVEFLKSQGWNAEGIGWYGL